MSETALHFESAEEEAAFIASVEEANRQMDEGHYVTLEEVTPWLLSWGTDHELPPPKCR